MAGYDLFSGWGEETTWGTPVARAQFARPYVDSVVTHEKPQQPHTFAGDRDPEAPFFLAERGVGSVNIPLVYAGMEVLIEHCMGAVLTSSGVGPFVHTFNLSSDPYTRATAPFVGLTQELHLGLPDSSLESLLLYGARCGSFGSNFRVNEETRWNSDWVGKQVVQAAKTGSPTYPDYANAAASPLVKFTQIVVTIDGSGSQNIYGLEWSVNNSLRDDRAILGSQYIAAPVPQAKREITGTIEKEWLSKTHYDKFIAGTTATILATATGPGNFVMTVEFPNVFYTGGTPEFQEAETQDYSLPFIAYDDATKGAMQITITNDTATP